MKHLIMTLSVLALSLPAWSGSAAEAEFQNLVSSRQPAALEALARSRLATDPLEEAALWYWGEQDVDDPRVRELLRAPVAECLSRRPRSARCHHLMGLLLTMDMMEGGLSSLFDLGKVRGHFDTAVKLEPGNFAMRRDLVGYYLEVPGLLGGSVRRARELAADFTRLDSPRASLLEAAISIHEREFDQARRQLDAVPAGEDIVLRRDLQSLQAEYGQGLLEDGDAVRAREWFDKQVSLDAMAPEMHVGLARALAKLGESAAAARAYAQALSLNPRLHERFRMAEMLDASGATALAIAAFRASLDDPAERVHAAAARKRLAELGIHSP